MRLLVYHMQGKSLYKGQLSRSCRHVNRFAVCQQAIVVARGKPAKIVRKKQQLQFIQSNFFKNKPKVIQFHSPVLRLRSFFFFFVFFFFLHTYISLFSNNYLNKFDMPTGS